MIYSFYIHILRFKFFELVIEVFFLWHFSLSLSRRGVGAKRILCIPVKNGTFVVKEILKSRTQAKIQRRWKNLNKIEDSNRNVQEEMRRELKNLARATRANLLLLTDIEFKGIQKQGMA